MAFVTGTALTMAELISGLQSACTSNGWSLTGTVLHKGACYVDVSVPSGKTYLEIAGGTGVDGTGLTGKANSGAGRIGDDYNPYSYPEEVPVPFAFPVTYDVFINTDPDEVYLVVKYGSGAHQTAGFGVSDLPGLSGTGCWYSGTHLASNNPIEIGYRYGDYLQKTPLFCSRNGYAGVHSAISDNPDGDWGHAGEVYAVADWGNKIWSQPNTWDGSSTLLPIRVYARRSGGYYSPVLELRHARHLDMSLLQNGQVISLGQDRWKVYPWFVRGPRIPFNNWGNRYYNHYTGQFGHAFRYDGP